MLRVQRTYYKDFNVDEKEELKSLLKKYGDTLNKPTLEYLNALIELEFSVVKDNISSTKKENLIELELYRRIAIYNIYNRVLNLLRSHEELDIHSNSGGYEGIYVTRKLENDSTLELFNFDYDINRSRVGKIDFYETREKTLEERNAEINYAKGAIERISKEKSNSDKDLEDIELDRKRRIEHYEKMLKELERERTLSDIDKKKRARDLINLSKQLEDNYYQSFKGKCVDVLIEECKDNVSMGHTSNYLMVKLKESLEVGKIYQRYLWVILKEKLKK